MAPPLGSYSGTVAELFATLGLDSSGFEEGLRKSQIKLESSANTMKGQILSLHSLLKQLETQVGPRVAVETFDQLNRRLSQSTTQLFKFQQEVMPALLQAQHVQETMGGGTRATDVGSADEGGGGRGRLGIVAALTQRFLIYQGLRLAVQGFTSALHEADDITRRMDQTGWGSKGVQQLQLMMERLHAPADQATASIARFEEKIDSGDLSAIKALDRLGLKWSQVRAQMAVDPQGGLETTLKAINASGLNQGEFANISYALFQDRSGKMLAFIKEYTRLKEQAAKSPILSDEDKAAVENFNWMLQRLGQLGTIGVGKVIGAIMTPEGENAYAGYDTPGAGLPQRRRDIELNAPPEGAGPVGGPNAPDSAALSHVRSMLDQFRGPHELAQRKMQEDWAEMLLLERQGVATHAQVMEFASRISMKMREEMQQAIDEQIRGDVALLNEFGAQGKRTAEVMTRDFAKLEDVFRSNRITVQEMTEATSNYFSMLEDNAARPALKQAIKMFEMGLIGPQELLKARERAKAGDIRGEAESAFSRGDMSPEELMRAQRLYRQRLEQFAPDRGSSFQMGPGGSVLRIPRRDSLPPISPSDRATGMSGGSINIIPLDRFSETMIRSWKQQGLLTR